MTTAHRATWKAARGGLQEEGSFRLHVPSVAASSKDAPTEHALKLRTDLDLSRGQLRSRLEGADAEINGEDQQTRKRPRTRFAAIQHETQPDDPCSLQIPTAERNLKPNQNDNDDGDSDDDENEIQLIKLAEPEDSANVEGNERKVKQQDDEEEEAEEDDDDDDDDDESSSEEDEAELRAEVEKIRREREMERAKMAAAIEEEERKKQEEEEQKRIANSNPLLGDLNGAHSTTNRDVGSGGGGVGRSILTDDFSETASIATGSVAFSVRRRWDDDVAFRNQAGSGREEHNRRARFINDTIHNDFHKRFMKRYMK